jgi:hypothetical protein
LLEHDQRECFALGPEAEVYRFGGHEIADRDRASSLLDDFFSRLLDD